MIILLTSQEVIITPLKCDCFNGSIVNGVREPILYSFSLDKPTRHKVYKEPRIKLFKKVNKSVFITHTILYRRQQ